jgi:hypothetical protein
MCTFCSLFYNSITTWMQYITIEFSRSGKLAEWNVKPTLDSYAGFEDLTAETVKSTFFRSVTQCSLVLPSPSGCHLLPAGFLLGLLFDPEDGGSMFIWNIWLLPAYVALHTIRFTQFNCFYNMLLSLAGLNRVAVMYWMLLGLEDLVAVTLKDALFWVVTPCNLERIGCLRGTYYLHLQGWRISQARN